MKNMSIWKHPARIFASLALLAIALTALIAVPIVASAGDVESDASNRSGLDVATCADRSGGDHPRMQRFLEELVQDQVISVEQADEIASRLTGKHFNACVARILFERGTAIEATATVTDSERREVLGALVSGKSLSEYAAQHGVDDATLVAAIMAEPAAKAAELVAAGELNQEVADDILGKLEAKVSEVIQMTDVKPRHFRQLRQSLEDQGEL